jgi:hypothetical protein
MPYMPPMMAAAVAANEANEARQAELDDLAREEDAEARRMMADHAESVHVAATGYTSAELRQAEQARIDALSAREYDPGAPAGTRQHPEVLIDGASLVSAAERRPGTVARSAAVTSAADRDYVHGSPEWCLARNAELAADWDGPVIRRQRTLSRRAEIARAEADHAAEVSRSKRLRHNHRPPSAVVPGGPRRRPQARLCPHGRPDPGTCVDCRGGPPPSMARRIAGGLSIPVVPGLPQQLARPDLADGRPARPLMAEIDL